MARQHMTLFNVLQGFTLGRGASVSRGGKSATRNFSPQPFPRREGLRKITPEELLSVRVPVVRIIEGRIEGYQRKFTPRKARAIARWLEANRADYLRTMPVIEISVTPDGEAFYTDGQHRAAGAVMAGLPLRAVITRRSQSEARRLFALQGKATRPSRDLLIIDSEGPFEEYIQDAITSDNHPWSCLITSAQNGSSKTKISPTAAHTMLQIYIRGINQSAARAVGTVTDPGQFDKKSADLLADLILCFGKKTSNPLAYSAIALRAISLTARAVLMDRVPHPEDLERWYRHMPKFEFRDYAYLKSSNELADKMIKHWNFRMPPNRKATRLD